MGNDRDRQKLMSRISAFPYFFVFPLSPSFGKGLLYNFKYTSLNLPFLSLIDLIPVYLFYLFFRASLSELEKRDKTAAAAEGKLFFYCVL